MIMIKGVQTVEDAEIAAEMGVDGVILSNHGGRQLDYACPYRSRIARCRCRRRPCIGDL